MDKQELLNAVNLITEFLDARPGGESYWVDDEGQNHDADMGYVNEFLDDLKLYLEGKWGSPEVDPMSRFNYFVRWRWMNGAYDERVCGDIRIKKDRVELENANTCIVSCIPFKKVSGIEVIEIKSGKQVFNHGNTNFD